MTCVQGFATQYSADGQQYEFTKIVAHTVKELTDQTKQGIRGVLDHPSERVAPGRLFPAYDVYMDPSATDLSTLLALMAFTESPTNTFTIGDAYSTFTSVIDYAGTKVHTYTGCVFGALVFQSQRGGVLSMMAKVYATGFSEGTDFGSPTAMTADYVWGFQDGALTLQASARQFDRFKLLIDPHMEVQWNNSATPTQICPTDRDIILQTSTPYDSTNKDLFTTPLGSADGAAASLVFTRGSNVLTFSLGNLKAAPARVPSILNKGQVRLPVSLKAYTTGNTAALGVTLVYP